VDKLGDPGDATSDEPVGKNPLTQELGPATRESNPTDLGEPDPVTRRPERKTRFFLYVFRRLFRGVQWRFPVKINGDFGRISKEIIKVISCDLFELYWIFWLINVVKDFSDRFVFIDFV
jgi:hypothetical protein